jgi:hypothetical protein
LNRKFRLGTYLGPALMCAALLLWGCQAKEAPLSPGAAAFKTEIKNCLVNLASNLTEPVARQDKAAIAAALRKVESPAVRLCSLCPFQVGVLNPAGEILSTYPSKGSDKAKNFSSYDLFIRARTTKKIQHQQFFLQDGTELYIICAPLIQKDKVLGLAAIAVSSADAKQRWDLTEKDFMAINFNT